MPHRRGGFVRRLRDQGFETFLRLVMQRQPGVPRRVPFRENIRREGIAEFGGKSVGSHSRGASSSQDEVCGGPVALYAATDWKGKHHFTEIANNLTYALLVC